MIWSPCSFHLNLPSSFRSFPQRRSPVTLHLEMEKKVNRSYMRFWRTVGTILPTPFRSLHLFCQSFYYWLCCLSGWSYSFGSHSALPTHCRRDWLEWNRSTVSSSFSMPLGFCLCMQLTQSGYLKLVFSLSLHTKSWNVQPLTRYSSIQRGNRPSACFDGYKNSVFSLWSSVYSNICLYAGMIFLRTHHWIKIRLANDQDWTRE